MMAGLRRRRVAGGGGGGSPRGREWRRVISGLLAYRCGRVALKEVVSRAGEGNARPCSNTQHVNCERLRRSEHHVDRARELTAR